MLQVPDTSQCLLWEGDLRELRSGCREQILSQGPQHRPDAQDRAQAGKGVSAGVSTWAESQGQGNMSISDPD
jgi:hypothetical protein